MASSVVGVDRRPTCCSSRSTTSRRPWTLTGTPTIVAGTHRHRRQHHRPPNPRADYTIAARNESDTITIGFAWRITDVRPRATSCRVRAPTPAPPNTTGSACRRHGRASSFDRGSSTIVATSATGLVAANTWYYIEVQATLHDTDGTVTVASNGTDHQRPPGSTPGPPAPPNQLRVDPDRGGITNLFDDLYLTIGAGATFKGDITIP